MLTWLTLQLVVLAGLQVFFAPNPRLTMGISSGTRDVEIEIPLQFTPAREVSVGRLTAEVRFPSDKLSFVRVTGFLSEDETVTTQVSVVDPEGEPPAGEEGAFQIARVEISSPERALLEGTLVTMVFKVAEELEPEILALPLSAQMWQFPDLTTPIEEVETYEGRLSVLEPAVFFGCFFYMH